MMTITRTGKLVLTLHPNLTRELMHCSHVALLTECLRFLCCWMFGQSLSLSFWETCVNSLVAVTAALRWSYG